MVINGKKLTIKFFLNKDVKGKHFEFGGVSQYPLYVRVTFNRATTNFIVGNNWFSEMYEKDLEDIPELKEVKKTIGKIVQYEVRNSVGDYRVRGLGDRIRTYYSNIYEAIQKSLLNILTKELGSILSYNEFKQWQKLEFIEKVSKGFTFLGDQATRNLQLQAVLANVIGGIAQSYSVYQWVMTSSRFEFIEKAKKIWGDKSQKTKYMLAFGVIPVEGLSSEEGRQEMVRLIDDLCSQLLSLKYTSFVETESISYDEIGKVLQVKLK